jgi:hypothetical protein
MVYSNKTKKQRRINNKDKVKRKSGKTIKSKKYNIKGGTSHMRPALDNTILTNIANIWYYEEEKQCWWSDNQLGYYFSNLRNNYMSPTHLHIYECYYGNNHNDVIFDVRKSNDTIITIGYSTKVNNIQDELSTKISMPYKDIIDWMSKKCSEIFQKSIQSLPIYQPQQTVYNQQAEQNAVRAILEKKRKEIANRKKAEELKNKREKRKAVQNNNNNRNNGKKVKKSKKQ